MGFKTCSFSVSREVTFMENIYPFKEMRPQGAPSPDHHASIQIDMFDPEDHEDLAIPAQTEVVETGHEQPEVVEDLASPVHPDVEPYPDSVALILLMLVLKPSLLQLEDLQELPNLIYGTRIT